MTPTRRGFLAGSAAAALGAMLPASLMAGTVFRLPSIPPEEWRSIWAAPADELDLDGLAVRGRWPADLSLTLYRNGPALHTMGGYRYRHWFDGDGMIRAWTVGQRGASVRTRLIRTAKLTAEQAAGRRLLPAFGSLPPGCQGGCHGGRAEPREHQRPAVRRIAAGAVGSRLRLSARPGHAGNEGTCRLGQGSGRPAVLRPSAFRRDGSLWNFGLDYTGTAGGLGDRGRWRRQAMQGPGYRLCRADARFRGDRPAPAVRDAAAADRPRKVWPASVPRRTRLAAGCRSASGPGG